MVMGNLGLLAVQSVSFYAKNRQSGKYVISGLLAGVMLFVLFGLAPDTDVMAHFGGFLSGLVLGTLLASAPKLTRSGAANFLAGLAFTALVTWPWALAIRHA